MIKYPGPQNSADNHKLLFCSDGVPIKIKDSMDALPDWPQPAGIFKDGRYFNPLTFLQTMHDIYDTVTIGGCGSDESKAMEQVSFTRMLEEHLIVIPNTVLFQLFPSLKNSPKVLPKFIETLNNGRD